MPSLSPRVSWLLAATSGVWAATLLVLEWPGRWPLDLLLGCWFAAAAWVGGRRPWPGALLTASGVVALGLLGLPPDNAAPLAAAMIALAVTGYLIPWRSGIWSVPLVLLSMSLTGVWDLPSLVFGGLLLLVPWAFGSLVRARDARRRLAAAEAVRLALVDPAARARTAAATAREEDARSALALVDRAVAEMSSIARGARANLDQSALERIHEVGREATRELQALLLVLRDERPTATRPTAPAPEGTTGVGGARSWRRRWSGLAWPAVLILLDVWLTPLLMGLAGEVPRPAWPPPVPFVMLVVLPILVAVLLRAAHPVGALVGAAAVVVLGWSTGLLDVGRDGLWLAIAGAALSWSAGRVGSRWTFLAWTTLTGTVVVLLALDSPDNLPIHLTMHVMPLAAGAAWAGHHAAEAGHLDEARLRRAEIDAAERRAVAEARLRLARDLHDAASHAVGSMLMQANAARVLSVRDPAGARAALDAVVEIGTEAARDLRALSAVGDAQTGGPDARTGELLHTPPPPTSLSDAVRPLVAAVERAGSRVTTDLAPGARLADEDQALVLRVVGEGLANAARHAPGADVHVAVEMSDVRTRVRVTNGPARAADGAGLEGGSGLGLRGLRERLALRHGCLEAGPTGGPHPGWALVATFPTAPAPGTPARTTPAPQEASP